MGVRLTSKSGSNRPLDGPNFADMLYLNKAAVLATGLDGRIYTGIAVGMQIRIGAC